MASAHSHLPDRDLAAASFSTQPPRAFAFAGVSVEVALDASLCWELPESYARYLLAPSALPTCAAVVCSVHLDVALETPRGDVCWQRLSDANLRVSADGVVLELSQTGARRFVATARVSSPAALPGFLLLLAATVVELAGGLCLHATAVELEGKAVLLLGPSGAGKTTAAEQLGDVRCLAHDRVTVLSDSASETFWVWSLPVGSPARLAPSAAVALPLAAVLRIVQSAEPRVRPLRTSEAMLYVREAVEVGVGSGFFEAQRLAAVSALAVAAKSGIAEVVLRREWRADLARFLAQRDPLQPAAELGVAP